MLSTMVQSNIGILWSYIVQKHMPEYQYMIIGSNAEMCMAPSDQTFICSTNEEDL